MRRRYIWTIEEILALPDFGDKHGWFYGLCRDENGMIRLGEVLPGFGFVYRGPRTPKGCWQAIRDVRYFRPDRATPKDEMVRLAEQAWKTL